MLKSLRKAGPRWQVAKLGLTPFALDKTWMLRSPVILGRRGSRRSVGKRLGRKAHAMFKQQIESKDGWDPDPPLERPGKSPLRPDAGTPMRKGDPDNLGKRYYLELKPDTPSGRAAAARAVKRYQGLTDNKVRAVYYNPKAVK